MYDWAELRYFRYLLAILERPGFRFTAEQRHTSQPNLTMQATQFQEVYGVTHDELTSEAIPEDEVTRLLHSHFPDIPVAVLKELTGVGRPLLPPESWPAYFPLPALLSPLPRTAKDGRRTVRLHSREPKPLYGILGASDNTLVPFVQPGAIVEINTAVHTIEPEKVFHSMFERLIYFLRSHGGYHCGWCGLDAEEEWFTLVPSAMTMVSRRRWRCRQEVEVVCLVNRALTRVGFPEGPWFNHGSSHKRSNST
jgi:hypothetical protein